MPTDSDPPVDPFGDGDFDPLGPEAADGWRHRLDDLLDATGAGPRALAAALVALAVAAVAIWWVTQPPPVDVDAAVPLVVVPTTTTTAPTDLVVHVAGAVARPGVYTLPPGARLIDAIDAAGGPIDTADLDRINLASLAVDGGQLYVPEIGEAPPTLVDAGTGETAGPVDLNTATAAQLDALPGIGPATAAAIIDHRERHGPFERVDSLLDVPGIGEAKLAGLRDLVRV